jgi:hypothetical protein
MAKKAYRVRNWKDYNEGLVNRGSINFWFSEDCLNNWIHTERSQKRGRPKKYNDIVIECGLALKCLYRLTFRSTEGFIKSLVKLLQLNLDIPDYSLLCKRQKNLTISLPTKAIKADEKITILVDSTGIKIYGEGEWKVRQHGYTKRRTWRKLHIALNGDTQEIEAFELTELGIQDWEGFEMLVKKLPKELDTSIGDGAYNNLPCYELAETHRFKLIAPPPENASTTKERGDKINKAKKALLKQRDETIEQVRALGRAEWKRSVGYHRRSLVETAMFRIKTLLGDQLSSRKLENQKVEAAIRCKIINRMTTLGMPSSYAID